MLPNALLLHSLFTMARLLFSLATALSLATSSLGGNLLRAQGVAHSTESHEEPATAPSHAPGTGGLPSTPPSSPRQASPPSPPSPRSHESEEVKSPHSTRSTGSSDSSGSLSFHTPACTPPSSPVAARAARTLGDCFQGEIERFTTTARSGGHELPNGCLADPRALHKLDELTAQELNEAIGALSCSMKEILDDSFQHTKRMGTRLPHPYEGGPTHDHDLLTSAMVLGRMLHAACSNGAEVNRKVTAFAMASRASVFLPSSILALIAEVMHTQCIRDWTNAIKDSSMRAFIIALFHRIPARLRDLEEQRHHPQHGGEEEQMHLGPPSVSPFTEAQVAAMRPEDWDRAALLETIAEVLVNSELGGSPSEQRALEVISKSQEAAKSAKSIGDDPNLELAMQATLLVTLVQSEWPLPWHLGFGDRNPWLANASRQTADTDQRPETLAQRAVLLKEDTPKKEEKKKTKKKKNKKSEDSP